ncbi:MAG: hypothetical protein ACI4NW_11190 [Stenotrophomonas sp.]
MRVRPNCRYNHSSKHERGQALILSVAFVAVLSVGVLVMFSNQQSLARKTQLVNAADAAAYSVAVQQARVLNFAAYGNRARVANEVAVAQMVGMYSWLNQVHKTSRRIKTTLNAISWVPYIGQVAAMLARVFQAIDVTLGRVRPLMRQAFDLAIVGLDAINGALANGTRLLFNTATRSVDAIKFAGQIVEANAPGARLSAAGSAQLTTQLHQAFNTFTTLHKIPQSGTSTGADRFRNVVMKSRDRFSRTRDKDAGLWPLRLNQAGGTDMVGYNQWAAVDTLSLEVSVPPPKNDFDVPLGWGGAQAVQRYQNQSFLWGINNGNGWRDAWDGNKLHRPYGDARRQTGRTLVRNANRDPNVGGQRSGSFFTGQGTYTGLRDYYDVADGKGTNSNNDPRNNNADKDGVGPVFTLHVQSAQALSRTSPHIDGMGAGQMALTDKTHGGDVSALASAQVYFNRPFALTTFARGDRKLEVGNLFNPYWQARLVETPTGIASLLGAMP